MPPKTKKRTELNRLRGEYNKTFALEIVFGLATVAWLFSGFYVSVSTSAWFVILIVLGCLDCIFENKRKRLARKIDTAEGVIAAKES